MKIYRKLLNWDWYTDIPVKVLYIHCILRANWRPQEWKGITIERGQFVTSLQNLSLETGLTLRQIRRALDVMVEGSIVARCKTAKSLVITVLNYDELQSEGTIMSGNVARSWQETWHDNGNSNKNIKNIKNNKNIDLDLDRGTAAPSDNYFLSKPTLEDVDNYAKARQSVVDPKRFFKYYNKQDWRIKGKPIDNWRAVFQSWEKKELKKETIDKAVVILFEDRYKAPYYGFPAEWFDGEQLILERVRSGTYKYSENDIQQLNAEGMIKEFNNIKEENEREQKIEQFINKRRKTAGDNNLSK